MQKRRSHCRSDRCWSGRRSVRAEAAESAVSVSAGTGKYVSDVFIAYGKTEEEAVKWLTDNGWEPLPENANVGLGKASAFDDEIAVVMGIRRTNKVNEAITDMAVMNMKGGYSIPAYEELLEQKKAQIDEMIRMLLPLIREFRANYNEKGSELGKKRADLAYSLLNRFYDGDPEGNNALNDTGMKLGDLFLAELKQELKDGDYEKLSESEKRQHGDLQQIILETSRSAVSIIYQLLVMAADDTDTTWLERLSDLSGGNLQKNIADYIPKRPSLSDRALPDAGF